MAEFAPRGSFEPSPATQQVVDDIERQSRPVSGPTDIDDLVARVSDAKCVLLGEASHGTSEYYRWRALLTARLVREHDFSFVAVEGDWTSCYQANRFLKGAPGAQPSARQVLSAFDRWPTWMWANWETAEFFDWLEVYNGSIPSEDRVGFYGLDLYCLHESMDAVVEYLEDVDPDAAAQARDAYRCFEPYGEDPQEYARALRMVPESCEDEVVQVLSDLRSSAPEYDDGPDDQFNAEQNALVARNAEEYYRTMVQGTEDSWNVRDRHMAQTLDRLFDYHGPDARGIVWAHNTHVGDARATDMPQQGRLNIGQLVRERRPADEVAVVGFGSYAGSVIAGREWGAEPEEMTVPDAREGSYEDAFHRAGREDRLLFTDDVGAASALAEPRGHRAIGVVYRPRLEAGNYVPTVLPDRYDAFVYLDETRALHPVAVHPEKERVPELYPSGL